MKWQAAMLGAVLGCGDAPGPSDAAPELAVTVLAPNGGETLYAAEEVAVRWTGATSPMAVYDVALVDAGGGATPIQTAIAVPAGQPGSTMWTPVGVPAPTRYRIRVTVTVDGGRTAVDESDAEFTVSPPAQGVSLAAHLQPIFTARCAAATCHSAESQAAVLTLTPGAAYGALVDVPSRHAACASYRRVLPGQPDQSFLVYKLEGAGPCFAGVRMPKDAPPVPASELQRVRDWIASGAKNN